MDADKEVPEEKEKDLMSVGTAMTATQHIRRLLQSTGAPISIKLFNYYSLLSAFQSKNLGHNAPR